MLHIHFSHEPIHNTSQKPGDQRVLELVISQQEGAAALAELTLIPGSMLYPWCAISEDDDVLFCGQLAGVSDQDAYVFKVTYRACSAMPIAPTHLPYDPLFFDETAISQYLEASPYLFYFNRCTGLPQLSHVYDGPESVHLEHILKIDTRTLHAPYQAVHASISVEWVQQHQGVFDLMPSIQAMGRGGELSTLTPHHLIKSWPKEGVFLPSSKGQHKGYKVIESSLDVDDVNKDRSVMKGHIWIDWQYKQKRCEKVSFTVKQTLDPLWQGAGVKSMMWRLQAIDDSAHPAIPITSASFFNTERGQKAIDYARTLAQHYLYLSRRCLETVIIVPFNMLARITLNSMATWGYDEKGKIAGYRFVRSAAQSYGEIIVRRMIDGQCEELNKTWVPINPKGMLDIPALSLVEKIEIHNDDVMQKKHIEEGGRAEDLPTKIFVKLAELGKKDVLAEEIVC